MRLGYFDCILTTENVCHEMIGDSLITLDKAQFIMNDEEGAGAVKTGYALTATNGLDAYLCMAYFDYELAKAAYRGYVGLMVQKENTNKAVKNGDCGCGNK